MSRGTCTLNAVQAEREILTVSNRPSLGFVALAALIGAGLILTSLSAVVDASRAPTKKERKWIRKASMKHCRNTQPPIGIYGCEWQGGIRVSTVNPRYAWANSVGTSHSTSGILRRKGKRAKYWRVIVTEGGGILSCSHWYRKAPRRVVRDLRVRGFYENSGSFDYRRC